MQNPKTEHSQSYQQNGKNTSLTSLNGLEFHFFSSNQFMEQLMDQKIGTIPWKKLYLNLALNIDFQLIHFTCLKKKENFLHLLMQQIINFLLQIAMNYNSPPFSKKFDIDNMGHAHWYLQGRLIQNNDFSIQLDQSCHMSHIAVLFYLNTTISIYQKKKKKNINPHYQQPSFQQKQTVQKMLLKSKL